MKKKTFQEGSKRAGFTLIELLIVVAIIGTLVMAILGGVSQGRKKARLNGAKTALQTVLPAIAVCRDSNSPINSPVAGISICAAAGVGLSGAKWPALPSGYAYLTGEGNIDVTYAGTCFFKVATNDNAANRLTCSCATQVCQ